MGFNLSRNKFKTASYIYERFLPNFTRPIHISYSSLPPHDFFKKQLSYLLFSDFFSNLAFGMLTLALLPPIDDWVYIVVYTIYAITILGTIVIIITENRNPVKSLAWVLVLAFLPIVGLVFYIFFGQNFKAKRMVSRRIKRKLRKRDYHSIVNIDSLPLSEESKQEIRLCHSLCSVPYYSGSHVKIFTSGEDKFKHYLQDLEIAQEYIHIQYYIFEDDKLGNRVKEVLLRCARRGIQIRILYDDVGCWSVKKRFFKEMQDAGIAVRPFLEITFPQLASRINYRNHRKITVIDGKIGYIGPLLSPPVFPVVSSLCRRNQMGNVARHTFAYRGACGKRITIVVRRRLELRMQRGSFGFPIFSTGSRQREKRHTNRSGRPHRGMVEHRHAFLESDYQC